MPSPFFDPFNGNGTLLYAYANKAVWVTEVDGQLIGCTQEIVHDILDDNQRELANNEGKRWGEGKVARRIPLGFYFSKILPARLVGDERYEKKILNDIDYQKFRVFPGRI